MAAPLSICYLNGEYVPLAQARISPLDRGFLFADSVYEVLPVFEGRPYRFKEHFDRLDRSLGEIRIASPHSHAEWAQLLSELITRNGASNVYIYVQVTRGMEFGRNHAFPAGINPSVFAMASPLPELTPEIRTQGLSAITIDDFRWGRCDIKTTALLANILMKQAAADVGAQEAIIVRDGEVLEGSSSSVFVVMNGIVVTPPNSRKVLPGTTRDAVLELAKGTIPTQIRSIRVEELQQATEIWIAAATRDVVPITKLDGTAVGNGKPGPMWQTMCATFATDRQRLAGTPIL
jgi:D-alanine transaminase